MTETNSISSNEDSPEENAKNDRVPNNENQKVENNENINNQKESVSKEKNRSPQPDEDNLKLLTDLILKDIRNEKAKLENELLELREKKSKLDKELTSSFSGQSDAIARRVKGFQDYLTGALQGLAQAAEQLELVSEPVLLTPSPLDKSEESSIEEKIEAIPAVSDTFKPDEDLIRSCLEQFLAEPDFYANSWKLRRSLEPEDLNLLEDWFFNMGGRGAQPSRGSRSKNILVSAGLISILGELYGDRFQVLILASQPERLGEWRRGLQDSLGLNREDFGPNSGIVLFERSDGLIEKADRLEERNEVPLIIIDAAERTIDIPILQFPIWLAFAASPDEIYAEEEII